MSAKQSMIVVTGGRVIDPASGLDESRDILIEGGVIAAVDKPGSFSGKSEASVVDAKGCVVAPGLLDIHVHLREPGQEWKETIATGCDAAVAGGFTSICCMPNTVPAVDKASVVEFILQQAAKANGCRVFPIGTITLGREGHALSPMLELRDAGCVAFSDDGAPVSDAQIMRRALEYNRMLGTVLTVHEEELSLSDGFAMNESALSLKLGLKGMPEAAENVMIARDIELARLTGGRVHFCHVSTARGVTLIRRAKEDGIPVTAEVTPQNLTLDESFVADYDTHAKMSMPLRTKKDNEALVQALADGVIDCIASDHAPHEADSKRREFEHASFGMLGLQTTLPITLSLVRAGKLSMKRAIEALTSAPARCFNMPHAGLKKGAVADITVIDPERSYVLAPEHILSKSKNTPLFGMTMQGHAASVLIGGRLVYSAEQGFIARSND